MIFSRAGEIIYMCACVWRLELVMDILSTLFLYTGFLTEPEEQ